MRAHEFLEAETGTDYARDIDREFRRLGYKKLGSGADAKVWAADDDYIIKIGVLQDLSNYREGLVKKTGVVYFYQLKFQHFPYHLENPI